MKDLESDKVEFETLWHLDNPSFFAKAVIWTLFPKRAAYTCRERARKKRIQLTGDPLTTTRNDGRLSKDYSDSCPYAKGAAYDWS